MELVERRPPTFYIARAIAIAAHPISSRHQHLSHVIATVPVILALELGGKAGFERCGSM